KITCGVVSTVRFPNEVMRLPSRQFGDPLLADRTSTLLFSPQKQRKVGDIETSASLIAGSARIAFILRHSSISVNPLHQLAARTIFRKSHRFVSLQANQIRLLLRESARASSIGAAPER